MLSSRFDGDKDDLRKMLEDDVVVSMFLDCSRERCKKEETHGARSKHARHA